MIEMRYFRCMYCKAIVGIVCTGLFFGMYACNEQEQDVNEKKSALVMAEDSELALLMRQMTEETDSIRAAVLAGEDHELWSRIRELHTAKPTDASSSGPVFEGFAAAFIGAVEEMQAADTAHTQYYNDVINRCMDCHQQFCPGPMKRIRKFYVEDGGLTN